MGRRTPGKPGEERSPAWKGVLKSEEGIGINPEVYLKPELKRTKSEAYGSQPSDCTGLCLPYSLHLPTP